MHFLVWGFRQVPRHEKALAFVAGIVAGGLLMMTASRAPPRPEPVAAHSSHQVDEGKSAEVMYRVNNYVDTQWMILE
jgi:hypothetical protein